MARGHLDYRVHRRLRRVQADVLRLGVVDPHAIECRERRRIDVLDEADRDVPQSPLPQRLDRVHVDQPARADDPDPIGDVLYLVERVRGEEHGAAVGGSLPRQPAELALVQRVEPGRGLVEDQDVGRVHEGLDDPELLAVSPRELAEGAVEHAAEAFDELVAQRRRRAAPQSRERIEVLLPGESVGETQVSGQIPDPPPRLDSFKPCDPGGAGRRMDQVEEEPDRRALARPVRAEVAEDLGALDAEVEIDEGADSARVRLREPAGLDGGRVGDMPMLRRALLGDRLEAPADLLRVRSDVIQARQLSEALEAEDPLEERRDAVADGADGVVTTGLSDQPAFDEARDDRVGRNAAQACDLWPRARAEVRDHGQRLQRRRRQATLDWTLEQTATRLRRLARRAERPAAGNALQHDPAAPFPEALAQQPECHLYALPVLAGRLRQLLDRQGLRGDDQQRLERAREPVERVRRD